MVLPPGAGGGLGQHGQEQERRAYLPEDEDYWGTEPPLPGPAVGAIHHEAAAEQDFEGPRLIVGIGAEAAPKGNTETMSDWRMG
jgi:hypothetical protein